jgi:hypothetical protein
MDDLLTTLLEVLGLLLLAAGAVAGLAPLIGWCALAVGGLVLIGGSVLMTWLSSRPPKDLTETGR